MKPGELERNLSRLAEVAKAARERLDAMERELAILRRGLETMAGGTGPSRSGEQAAAAPDQGRMEAVSK